MQVDRARALRSEEGTVVENCSLSRRVARVAANGENGEGGPWGGSIDHGSVVVDFFLSDLPALRESNRLLRAHATAGSCFKHCHRHRRRRGRDVRHS